MLVLSRKQSERLRLGGDIVVPVQPRGDAPPLFALPPAGGIVYPYYHLAHLLGTDRPFLALQDPVLRFGTAVLDSVEAYANYYLDHIRRVQPSGPYHLLGWSMGGDFAYEIARGLLRQEGDQSPMPDAEV